MTTTNMFVDLEELNTMNLRTLHELTIILEYHLRFLRHLKPITNKG